MLFCFINRILNTDGCLMHNQNISYKIKFPINRHMRLRDCKSTCTKHVFASQILGFSRNDSFGYNCCFLFDISKTIYYVTHRRKYPLTWPNLVDFIFTLNLHHAYICGTSIMHNDRRTKYKAYYMQIFLKENQTGCYVTISYITCCNNIYHKNSNNRFTISFYLEGNA